MSDIISNLNHISQPIQIKYTPNYYGFSNPNNNTSRYLFELLINGKIIGKKYFKNLEETKYAHLIKLNHKIKLSNIDSYKALLSIYSLNSTISYELEGIINQYESSSTHYSDKLYIEFTKNDIGYTLCSCFYTELDNNKIFVSPPN
jgi:hypothetical protein